MSRPNYVGFRFSIFLIGMPITPNIIQTMKQTVKAQRAHDEHRPSLCAMRWGTCALGQEFR